ncbi:MAG: hypothetical protein ACTSR8_08450 [Promethearchaeota archaeon]
MIKYEYNVMNTKDHKELKRIWRDLPKFEKFLNEKGQQGWKLTHERDMNAVWTIIFRRRIE